MKRVGKTLSLILVTVLFCSSIIVGNGITAFAGSTVSMTWDQYWSKVTDFINDSRWKNGATWGDRGPYISSWPSSQCCAYTADFAKYVFDKSNQSTSGVEYTNVADIRAGDVLYITNHWLVVLNRTGDSLYTAEGNVTIEGSKKVRISDSVYYLKNGTLYSKSNPEKSFVKGYHFLHQKDVVTPISLTFKALAEKSCREAPYGSSTEIRKTTVGETVNIVGYVYNDAGNLWYKNDKGEFLYGVGYLECLGGDTLPLSNAIDAKMKVECSSKRIWSAPIGSADVTGEVKQGEIVEVKSYLYNKYGNLYYELTGDRGFIFASDLSTVSSDRRTPSGYVVFKATLEASSRELKNDPYGSADTTRTLSKGQEVKIQGYLYNKYGNLWYITDKGDYIYESYINYDGEDFIPQSNYLTAKGRVTCTSKRVWENPHGKADVLGTVNKGDVVDIIGYVYNQYGNLYYELSGGGFLYGSDLMILESIDNIPFDYINATFRLTKAHNAKQDPYSASNKNRTINAGEIVSIKGYVYNTYGNLWYITDEGDYIYHDNMVLIENDYFTPADSESKTITTSKTLYGKSSPYYFSSTSNEYSNGTDITTVGYIYNLFGEKWYETEDGSFINDASLNCYHDYVTVYGYPATCTASGKTDGSYCSVCSEILVPQEDIPPLGHDIVNHSAKAPTCTEKGWDAYQTCTRCSYSTYSEKSALGHIDTNNDYYCDRCGTKLGEPPHTHSYTPTVTRAATCTSTGIITYTCSCGDSYAEIAPILPHREVTDRAVEATCISTGKTQGSRCGDCGAIINAQSIIPLKAHTYNSGNVTKAPTCKDTGTKTYSCTFCGDSYTETIAKLTTHSYDNGVVTTLATCTETGIMTYTCTTCGETKTETIAKSAHTYKNVTTKATTTKNGKIENKCSVCGKVSKTTTIYAAKALTLKYSSATYTGKALKPSVTVKDSKGNVIDSKYYTVKYTNNTKVGKATVTVTFKGNYSGTLTKTFKINPKGTSLSSVTAKSKGFEAKWKKQSTQTTGYEIQYSTSSKFTDKTTKSVTVKDTKTLTKTITKLKASTKYYVRIRTYKTVSKTNYYSSWSAVKTVTTKK